MPYEVTVHTRAGRHMPRLCQNCGAPMSADTERCSRCHEIWVKPDEPVGFRPLTTDTGVNAGVTGS